MKKLKNVKTIIINMVFLGTDNKFLNDIFMKSIVLILCSSSGISGKSNFSTFLSFKSSTTSPSKILIFLVANSST